jgi:hypothetical protein
MDGFVTGAIRKGDPAHLMYPHVSGIALEEIRDSPTSERVGKLNTDLPNPLPSAPVLSSLSYASSKYGL